MNSFGRGRRKGANEKRVEMKVNLVEFGGMNFYSNGKNIRVIYVYNNTVY